MAENIQLKQITPVKPKVLDKERIFVYVPVATTTSAGIAQFDANDFSVNSGKISLAWPVQNMITSADPLARPSLTKVLDDEFVHTGNTTSITLNGKIYTNNTSEIKFNRADRNVFVRPDLVMLDNSDNDFVVTKDVNNYNKYKLAKNNPLSQTSLVKVNNKDFDYVDNQVVVKWPIANNAQSLTGRTNGYGLMKIDADGKGYLKYDDNGNVAVDYDAIYNKMNGGLQVKPTYGADAATGFSDYSNFVDENGIAKKDSQGRTLLKVTKDAVGLSKVANKAFSDYTYDDFGQSMKTSFETKFNDKLDKSEWNNLFSDWQPKSTEINTPHKWLVASDNQIDSIWDTLSSMGRYLGAFNTPQELQAQYPASEKTKAFTAFVLSTNTYWAVKQEGGYYMWYDTKREDITFYEAMETDPNAYKSNNIVPSAGSSGKWAQSDHVHPSDVTRLSKSIYQATNLTITSESPNEHDFKVDFWEKDNEGNPLANPDTSLQINIPYVKTAQYLHNWANSIGEFSTPNNELYWAGSETAFKQLDTATIPNNSLLIVDDGENTDVLDLVYQNQMQDHGVSLDDSSELFVITNSADNLIGLPLTIKNGNKPNQRYLDKLQLVHSTESNPMVVAVKTANGTTLQSKYFNPGRVITSSGEGTPIESDYPLGNFLLTSNSSTEEPLDTNRILLTKSGNVAKTFDTGIIKNRVLVSDGNNGLTMLSDLSANKIIYADTNGALSSTNLQPENVIKTTNDNSSKTLSENRILISRADNVIDTFDTGETAGLLLMTNGENGVMVKTLPTNQLLITDNSGKVTTLPSSEINAGQYYGVSADGRPTLITPPTMPNALPVKTFSSNPTTAQVDTVLVFADPNGNYVSGCLYLY